MFIVKSIKQAKLLVYGVKKTCFDFDFFFHSGKIECC
jgi:hypothetical protein